MLSEVLKELRLSKGITQRELASIVNLTQQAIAKWERGLAEPDSETLKQLVDFYGVSFDYIFGREEKKPIPISEGELEAKRTEWAIAWDQASPELRRAAMAVLKSGKPDHE